MHQLTRPTGEAVPTIAAAVHARFMNADLIHRSYCTHSQARGERQWNWPSKCRRLRLRISMLSSCPSPICGLNASARTLVHQLRAPWAVLPCAAISCRTERAEAAVVTGGAYCSPASAGVIVSSQVCKQQQSVAPTRQRYQNLCICVCNLHPRLVSHAFGRCRTIWADTVAARNVPGSPVCQMSTPTRTIYPDLEPEAFWRVKQPQ